MKRVRTAERTPLAAMIDHTFLKSAGDRDAITKLCREAKKYGFGAVCVNPAEVRRAAASLKGSRVKVCTVIGFPLGQNATSIKCLEAVEALKAGATELDFVVNQRLLKYAPQACARELKLLVRAARGVKRTATLKLILECCALTEKEIVRGARLAKAAGFDFVKTSTGFGSFGARARDVALLRKTVGPAMGVKAAGGIHTRAEAEAMIASGADRIGASESVRIIRG